MSYINEEAEEEMKTLQEVIIAIRSIRSRMNVKPSKLSDLVIRCNEDQKIFYANYTSLIKSLGRVDKITIGENIKKPPQSATAVAGGSELYVPLEGLVDLSQEKKRLNKRAIEIERLLKGINSKLDNNIFLERAPKMVVEKEKKNLNKLNEELEKITINLEILK